MSLNLTVSQTITELNLTVTQDTNVIKVNPVITKEAPIGAGDGDMLKSVYDPNVIDGDAFATDNFINATTSKTTPIDADNLTIWDSISSIFKKLPITNLKAFFKTYFDGIYAPIGGGVEFQTYKEVFGLNPTTIGYWTTKDGITGDWTRNGNQDTLSPIAAGWSTFRYCAAIGTAMGNQTVNKFQFIVDYPGSRSFITGISIIKIKWTYPNIVDYATVLYESNSITWGTDGRLSIPSSLFTDTSIADGDLVYVFIATGGTTATGAFELNLKCSID